MGKRLLWPLLPALAAGLVYLNTIPNGFALDDIRLVRDNPDLSSSSGLARLLAEPYWGEQASGLYRPITLLSLGFNQRLTGDGPAGFHAGNVLLHMLATYLAGLALCAVLERPAALIAAGLFAVHPLHTEAVANIAGRAELMAAVFVLIAWWAHFRAGEADTGEARWSWATVAGLAFMLAVLSKENALLAPVCFLLADRLARRPPLPGAAIPLLHPAAPAYAVGLVAAFMLRVRALGGIRGAESMVFLDNPAAFGGLGTRVATALWVQLRYALLVVWPADLSSDYSFDAIPAIESLLDPRLAVALAWTVCLAALFLYGWIRSMPLALGVALWVLLLLPGSNLIFASGTLMGERLTYLPLLGPTLIAGHLLARLGSGRYSLSLWAGRLRNVTAIVVVTGMLGSLAWRTVRRNPVWRDNLTLAVHDARVMPRSAKLHAGAGIALHASGDQAGAEAAFGRALAIYPDYAQIRYNLGQILMQRGEIEEAITHLSRAAALSPTNPRPWKSLAPLYERTGRRDEALEAYARGTALDPADLPLGFNYGRALLVAGQTERAKQVLQELTGRDPDALVGALARGLLLELEDRGEEARALYESLLRRPGVSTGIRSNIAGRLAALDREQQAPGQVR